MIDISHETFSPSPLGSHSKGICGHMDGHFMGCKVYPPIRSPIKEEDPSSDIIGRRRPVGFVRESYLIRGGTL
jgi:hypothetical protein